VLLSFRLANFRSFRDEQEFSFVHGEYTSPPPRPSESGQDAAWDARVGTVAALYGANASGKSNVLKALDFMSNAVRNSYRRWESGATIPVEPFLLNPRCKNEPSLFEVVFVINRRRYQYGFRLTADKVVGEWLYVYPGSRRQIWFERDISTPETYYFGKNFPGRNRVIADLTRPDSLFLSTAAANNHPGVEMIDHWFRVHLKLASPEDRPARERYTKTLSRRDDRWKQITELMQFADLGICNARVRAEDISDTERERILRVLNTVTPDEVDSDLKEQQRFLTSLTELVEFEHRGEGETAPVYFAYDQESLGTQVWFALTGPIVKALNNGDALLVDELDASLHPQLSSEVLKIFRDPSKNPKQAQLLFTTHDTALLGSLLGDRELHRNQVWFTEKKLDGATVLYPLTDFSPRKSENLERGYLQGRYGAVPFLDEKVLAKSLRNVRAHEDHGADDRLTDAGAEVDGH
jgi:uncharacterized protein